MLKPRSAWGRFEGDIAEIAKEIIEQEVSKLIRDFFFKKLSR